MCVCFNPSRKRVYDYVMLMTTLCSACFDSRTPKCMCQADILTSTQHSSSSSSTHVGRRYRPGEINEDPRADTSKNKKSAHFLRKKRSKWACVVVPCLCPPQPYQIVTLWLHCLRHTHTALACSEDHIFVACHMYDIMHHVVSFFCFSVPEMTSRFFGFLSFVLCLLSSLPQCRRGARRR